LESKPQKEPRKYLSKVHALLAASKLNSQAAPGELPMKPFILAISIIAGILTGSCTAKDPKKAIDATSPAPAAGPFSQTANESKSPIQIDRKLAAQPLQPFRGNIKRKVLHSPSCIHYRCQNCTAIFTSIAEAKAKGYRLHRCIR
jgi:hypothetical protein